VQIEDFSHVSTSTCKQFRFVADAITLVVIVVCLNIYNNDMTYGHNSIINIHKPHAYPSVIVGNSQYVSTQQYAYINCTVRCYSSSV